MALKKTFHEFSRHLRMLHDRLAELRVTVVEDKPTSNDAALVDDLEYAVEDALGWLGEASASAAKAERAVGHPQDLEQARQSLARCQELLHSVDQSFSTNLTCYQRMKDLAALAAERKGEWPPFVSSVQQGIEQCSFPLEQSRRTLGECWEEIAEKAGTTSISVHTTSIGQKISRAGESERAGVTETSRRKEEIA